jgi:hypothetical protein
MLNHKITPACFAEDANDVQGGTNVASAGVTDATGNRSQLQIGATTTTYSYRPASNVMTNFNGSGVIVDALGNTTSLRGMTLTYDTLNRLKTISGATYNYNALNQRRNKTVNGITTNYIYGLSGELLAELDTAGGTQVQYIYRNGQPLSVIKRETVTPPPPPDHGVKSRIVACRTTGQALHLTFNGTR